MATLYQISSNLDDLLDIADTNEGEITEEQLALFEQLEGEFDDKLQRSVYFIKECEAKAAARREEARSLVDSAKALENKAKNLKRYILLLMKHRGFKKRQLLHHTVGIQKAGGKQGIEVISEERMPEGCFKTFKKLDLDQVRAMIELAEDGQLKNPDGVVVAELKPRGEVLTIR